MSRVVQREAESSVKRAGGDQESEGELGRALFASWTRGAEDGLRRLRESSLGALGHCKNTLIKHARSLVILKCS